MTVAEILMKRKRLHLQQHEAAKIAGLNPGTLVDIERERITVEDIDLERIDAAYETWANENIERQEVMA